MTSSGWGTESRPPGQRRQKVFGYLKAANELRQSYQTQLSSKWQGDDYDGGMPGGFPDADIVRNGDEEMLLFPSYAKRHTRLMHLTRDANGNLPGTNPNSAEGAGTGGDEDYWRQEWQRYEDENAVVDVDVRGWLYAPQRGPLSRRNRLILAVARRLSGIPALDASPSNSRDSSRNAPYRHKYPEDMVSPEEEAAAREAELIARRGQREADAASKGAYSAETSSLIDFSPTGSRSNSPTRTARPTASRLSTGSDLEPVSTTAQKRQSWNDGGQMTREEIVRANEELMGRLRPFMTLPLTNTPITIFFYNQSKSQSKSVYTDESGHFKVRAALDFVPDKVRVLASEKLSATEDVIVTDSRGVSLISDIDDTIKHSAIASGAKEIFRNTFLKELGELTVPGVKEWYSRMAGMGVTMHYVSNSPWQLYPLLRTYFGLAGLPDGSFHLKQYSGMLQGIFEPAAERKKGSLDKIMHDFPERKFILVGDSGEADLEVYTDIVLEHPKRILGVFIRDVTSPKDSNFFDPSQYPKTGHSRSSSSSRERSDRPSERPALPTRPKVQSESNLTGQLVDFSPENSPSSTFPQSSYNTDLDQLRTNERSSSSQPPNKPAKPSNLRSSSTSQPDTEKAVTSAAQQAVAASKRSPPPPPAPRRSNTSSSVTTNNDQDHLMAYGKLPPQPPPPRAPPKPGNLGRTGSNLSQYSNYEEGYLASARQQLSAAYNAIPAIRSQDPTLPPRRGLSAYPAAAARWATGAGGGDPAAGGDGGAPGQPYDKKLEMWRRRWARSEDIMRRNGVVLLTWRVGGDVEKIAAGLVQRELKENRQQ